MHFVNPCNSSYLNCIVFRSCFVLFDMRFRSAQYVQLQIGSLWSAPSCHRIGKGLNTSHIWGWFSQLLHMITEIVSETGRMMFSLTLCFMC